MEAELAKIKGGKQFGFDYLHRCVVDVIDLPDLPPDRQTMTTAKLRSIIDAIRSNKIRAERWNKKQTSTDSGS